MFGFKQTASDKITFNYIYVERNEQRKSNPTVSFNDKRIIAAVGFHATLQADIAKAMELPEPEVQKLRIIWTS